METHLELDGISVDDAIVLIVKERIVEHCLHVRFPITDAGVRSGRNLRLVAKYMYQRSCVPCMPNF